MIMFVCEEWNFKGDEYHFKKQSSLIWLRLPLTLGMCDLRHDP